MTPGEIPHATDRQLSGRRLALLQSDCPVCDEGKITADCHCSEDLREVELIDAELLRRNKT